MLHGKVQGVGFRAFTARAAAKYGITGWVRNRGTSKVELMYSATPEQSDAFVQDLKAGPKHADVQSLDLHKVRTRDFGGFKRLPSKGQALLPPKETAPLYQFDPEFVAMCQRLFDRLPAESKVHNSVDNIPSDWGFGQLRSEAQKCGVQVRRLGKTRPRVHLLEGKFGRLGLVATRPSHASVLQTTIADDKTLAALAMAPLMEHLPKSWLVNDVTEAIPHLNEVTALVAKPSRGSTAKGVTTNVTTERNLSEAFEIAQSADPEGRVQLEEHICGVDLRVLFVRDSLVAAYLRFPANVIADGKSTIASLIEAKNTARSGVPGIGAANPIPMNALTAGLLNDQGFELETVPEDGQFVQLGLRPNTADGADQIDITAQVHPDIINVCKRAIAILGQDGFWGFDVLSEDFTLPADQARVVICEANNRPFGGVFRHATHGTHHNFFTSVLTSLDQDEPDQEQAASTLPVIRLADASCPITDPAPSADASLEQALSEVLGPDVAPWKPGLLLQEATNHWKAIDTLAPTQFAEHLLRAKNQQQLRDVLETAHCKLMPWEVVKDAEALRSIQLPKFGRLVLNSKWGRRFDIELSEATNAETLAQRIPEAAYPIQLERWDTPNSLHVIVLEGCVIAAALSSGGAFKTYDRLIPSLNAHCQRVFDAIPGLNRARLIFRRTAGANRPWCLQAISADLMHQRFAVPCDGPSIDIAKALAARIETGTDQIRLETRPPA